jgi:hypothetical protein
MNGILFFAIVVHTSDAFLPAWQYKRPVTSKTVIGTYPECFDRAVECSSDVDRCSVDELLKLADELESYKGAFFEDSPTLQIKEVKDREDLADVLRLEAELQLRQDYLRKANIFCDNVKKSIDSIEKKDYMELMDDYADY